MFQVPEQREEGSAYVLALTGNAAVMKSPGLTAEANPI